MTVLSKAFLLLFCLQGIESLIVKKHHPTSFSRLSEKVLNEKVSVSTNGVPGNKEEQPLSTGFSLPAINGYSMPSGQKIFGYSTTLKKERPKWLPRIRNPEYIDKEMDEDGYSDMRKKRPLLKKALRFPLKVAKRVLSKKSSEPGTLILIRHGESQWNHNKTFTGWADPDLTEQGKREIQHAARLLMEGGYKIDVVFTSRLTRAIRSVWILLQELNETYLPVFKSWRLNERVSILMYVSNCFCSFWCEFSNPWLLWENRCMGH